MKTIIHLRRPNSDDPVRYISKNNANIARLRLLPIMVPDATILIVLRNPFEQAMSLSRQHELFTEMQDQDPFVRRYMSDIGHYEFGNLHKPIRFENSENLMSPYSKSDPNYWLAYWLAGFREVIETKSPNCIIVSYDRLCADAAQELPNLFELLGIKKSGAKSLAAGIRPLKTKVKQGAFEPALSKLALEVYDILFEKHLHIPADRNLQKT